MIIREIVAQLEDATPSCLGQESCLIVGDENANATGGLLCSNSTEAVIDEAIALGVNLVIAYNPIVLEGLKHFTGSTQVQRVVMKAIKHDVAIVAVHTTLDSASAGVNQGICDAIGIGNTRILAPQQGQLKKLCTYCPVDHAERVKEALFGAGAGHIGEYSHCSFSSQGTGTFRASDKASPFVGEAGTTHAEAEHKIEVVLPAWRQGAVVAALEGAHPYEEVAYDLLALDNTLQTAGEGMIGDLPEAVDEGAFLTHLKAVMKAACVRHSALRGKPVTKVAVCGGAGSFLLNQAMRQGADVLVTADFSHRQYLLEAEGKIVLADVGRHESEQFAVLLILEALRAKCAAPVALALHLSKADTNPINCL